MAFNSTLHCNLSNNFVDSPLQYSSINQVHRNYNFVLRVLMVVVVVYW